MYLFERLDDFTLHVSRTNVQTLKKTDLKLYNIVTQLDDADDTSGSLFEIEDLLNRYVYLMNAMSDMTFRITGIDLRQSDLTASKLLKDLKAAFAVLEKGQFTIQRVTLPDNKPSYQVLLLGDNGEEGHEGKDEHHPIYFANVLTPTKLRLVGVDITSSFHDVNPMVTAYPGWPDESYADRLQRGELPQHLANALSISPEAKVSTIDASGASPPTQWQIDDTSAGHTYLLQLETQRSDGEGVLVMRENVPPSQILLAYEYWNGTQWAPIPEIHDQTQNLTQDGTITFQCPADMQPVRVNGQNGYWIRSRIQAGNYGTSRSIQVKPGNVEEVLQSSAFQTALHKEVAALQEDHEKDRDVLAQLKEQFSTAKPGVQPPEAPHFGIELLAKSLTAIGQGFAYDIEPPSYRPPFIGHFYLSFIDTIRLDTTGPMDRNPFQIAA